MPQIEMLSKRSPKGFNINSCLQQRNPQPAKGGLNINNPNQDIKYYNGKGSKKPSHVRNKKGAPNGYPLKI
jgi:hypothetical protein